MADFGVSPFARVVESWCRSLAVLALTSVTGCSLALSGPGANRPRDRAPQCDTGKGLVALDGVVGSVLATGALVAVTDDESSLALVSGLLAVAYLGAALRGNSNVNECRTALAAYDGERHGEHDEERAPTRLSVRGPASPAPAPLPPGYVQPQTGGAASPPPPVVTPPVPPVAPPPPPPSPPPVATPTVAPQRPGPRTTPNVPRKPAEEGPSDWRDFWKEIP